MIEPQEKRKRFVQASRRHVAFLTVMACFAMLDGCARAPSFNILGSFFPAWLICMIVGVVLATVTRWLFARYNLDSDLPWRIVMYPCLAAFFAFTIWLVFFD